MPNLENKPKIAVDIDEVLFPMVSDLIEYVDKQHSVKLTPEQFIKYNLEDIWHGGPLEGAVVFDAYRSRKKLKIGSTISSPKFLKKYISWAIAVTA
jgi:5'(3')-deoxyribonucleotidase